MKKRTKIIIGIFIPVAVIFILAVALLPLLLTPTVAIDFDSRSELSGRASGFLYGFAEPDIPSREIAESIGVNSLSTKPVGGLQHPIGEVSQVADTFLSAGGELIVIYTQDMYDTWYYQLDSLPQYNEKVRKTVTETEKAPYRDKVAYCIYNEMDNGQWFGDFWQEENRQTFYKAWLSTYKVVKEINPNAKIAGPGHAGYNGDFIKEFLAFCKENNCLPDITVWHELGEKSLYLMEHHFNEYYEICDSLGIDRLPVCISEYGLMSTNGIPGESVKWINRLENADAYGCVAYWRLANNLSDTVADDVTPNSNYWVYNFYASMQGEQLKVKEREILRSNVENFLKGKEPLCSKGISAVASYDEKEDKIYILAGGTDKSSAITVKNIDETAFANGEKATVTVKSVDYKGLGGVVNAPEEVMVKNVTVSGGKLSFSLPCERDTQAFFIEITKYNGAEEEKNNELLTRYEAEKAKLIGDGMNIDGIAYACSEGRIVKNISNGCTVQFKVNVDKTDSYDIDFVYGCGPVGTQYNDDGSVKEKGVRTSALGQLTVNNTQPIDIKFPSTIKEEYMECVTYTVDLKEGDNILNLKITGDAPISLDFIDVTEYDDSDDLYFSRLQNRSTEKECAAYSVYAVTDSECRLFFSDYNNLMLSLNGSEFFEPEYIKWEKNCVSVYLPRGCNKIAVSNNAELLEAEEIEAVKDLAVFTPTDLTLTGTAKAEEANGVSYITGISSKGGTAEFKVNAPEAGLYQLTFEYANNQEGGFHAYNVDLVERYVTLSLNGEKLGNEYFRSTYSLETYKTKTVTVKLNAGENTITLSNDGSYAFDSRETFAPNIAGIKVNPV